MQEWPEEVYPPYANGPSYIISCNIAKFIVSQRSNQNLRVRLLTPRPNKQLVSLCPMSRIRSDACFWTFLQIFKMEDVSMGMWVEQFNSSTPVQYSHNWKFCQYGCMENYYTAHYQSPRQMMCLWNKLKRERAHCCNYRWHCMFLSLPFVRFQFSWSINAVSFLCHWEASSVEKV